MRIVISIMMMVATSSSVSSFQSAAVVSLATNKLCHVPEASPVHLKVSMGSNFGRQENKFDKELNAHGQSLNLPLENKNAQDKKTRSAVGQPFGGILNGSDRRSNTMSFVTSPAFWFSNLGCLTSIVHACSAVFCTIPWLLSLAGILLSVHTMAKSVFPATIESINLDKKEIFVIMFAAHLASATALPLLTSMLWPYVENKVLLLTSMFSLSLGSVAEIIGHFRDCWVFEAGCSAESGVENIIFSICLNAAFGLLAASFFPNAATITTGLLPAVGLISLAGNWRKNKATRCFTFLLSMSSSILMVASCLKFKSPWPILYFAQAFNIVRNGGRIKKTGIQLLHVPTSMYGWFSYILPFGLSIKYAGAKLQFALPLVLSASVGSIFLANFIENTIIKLHFKANTEYKLESFQQTIPKLSYDGVR